MSLRRYGAVLAFVLLLTVGLNVPYWIACRLLGLLPIGWFSLESLLAGLALLFVSRRAGGVLLIVFFAEDILLAVSRTYYLTPRDCLAHLWSLTAFPPSRFLEMLAGLVFALLFFVALSAFPVRLLQSRTERKAAAVGILLFGCLGLAADNFAIRSSMGRFAAPVTSSRAGDENRFTRYRSLWAFRYTTLRLRTAGIIFGYQEPRGVEQRLTDYSSMQGASDVGLANLRESLGASDVQPDVVLVVVESWGKFEDPRMRALFDDLYRNADLDRRYELLTGAISFHGSTVSGEARELCGADMGFDIESATANELRTCLPERLKQSGYETTAIHGMGSHFFMRRRWYQDLGFDDLWFRDRFVQLNLPDCVGAFRGTCDDAIAIWMTKRLRADHTKPQFLYWMTLNSHLPLPVPSGLANPASCAPLDAVTAPFCSWYQFVVRVHQSIAAMAAAAVRPTMFVVVGDHAPPFSNLAVRDQFSQSQVPYVILLPKRGAFTSSSAAAK